MKLFYNVVNSLIFCAKEARASIVQDTEWMQFVLQNCEKLHSVQGLQRMIKKAPRSTVYLKCNA